MASSGGASGGTSAAPTSVRLQDRAGTNTAAVVVGNGDGAQMDAALEVATYSYAFNDQSSLWDRIRANTQGQVLPSAARSVSLSSPNQTNFNARGVIVIINVTAVAGTTPTLAAQFGGVDPISGLSVAISPASGNITAVGTYVIILYPGVQTTGQAPGVVLSSSAPLPRLWNVFFSISGTAPTFTFSAGSAYVV